jgi:hypothetical protein
MEKIKFERFNRNADKYNTQKICKEISLCSSMTQSIGYTWIGLKCTIKNRPPRKG